MRVPRELGEFPHSIQEDYRNPLPLLPCPELGFPFPWNSLPFEQDFDLSKSLEMPGRQDEDEVGVLVGKIPVDLQDDLLLSTMG
jgi:hypothetical protein